MTSGLQDMQDITAPEFPVEIQIRENGTVLWINIGQCVLRVCKIKELIVNDMRTKKVE